MSNRPPVDSVDEGALFKPSYLTRTVPMIAVQERELRTISFFNTLATICFSLASGVLFLAVEFLWNAYADGQISRDEWPWLFISSVSLLVFGSVGGAVMWRRKTELDDI